MNNATIQIAALVEIYTQEVYKGYVLSLTTISSITLIVYACLLGFSQEIEYIWFKRFRLPSVLYVFARYGVLISQGLSFGIGLMTSPGRACNIMAYIGNITSILGSLIGGQGLLIVRAYSLCQRRKIMAGFLGFIFLSRLILVVIGTMLHPGCFSSENNEQAIFSSIVDVFEVVVDGSIFGICLWNIWETWKLKRETGVQSNGDIVLLFFRQIITRFFFAITITLTSTILDITIDATHSFVVNSLSGFQRSLSVILLTEFTLSLKKRNSPSVATNNASISTSRIGRMLQNSHNSVIEEMGDGIEGTNRLEFGLIGSRIEVGESV